MKDYQYELEKELEQIAEQNISEGYDEISAWDFSGGEMYQILMDLGCPVEEAKSIIINMGRDLD